MKSAYIHTLKNNAFAAKLKTLSREGALVASTALSARSNGGLFSTLAQSLLARLDLLQVGCIDTRLPRLGLIAHKVTSYKELTQARQEQTRQAQTLAR